MKFAALFVVCVSISLNAQGLKGLQYTSPEIDIPLGSTCYDMNSQMMLDNALDRGIMCAGTLKECRKWRDRYRDQLKKKCPRSQNIALEPRESTQTKEKWKKVLAVGLSSFLFGIVVGAGF